MSYILEALKKAEQKRRQGAVPDLLTVHSGPADKPQKQSRWPYVAASFLLVGGIASVWFYKGLSDKGLSPKPVAALPQSVQMAAPVQIPAPAAATPVSAAPAPVQPLRRESAPAPAKAPAVVEPEAREPRQNQKQALFKENELPYSIQQELPKVNISAHFYDENPSARIVSVRGNVLHEGQYAAAGLKLEKITPDGVILSYRDYRFFRPAF